MAEGTIEEGDRILVDGVQSYDYFTYMVEAEVYRVDEGRVRPYRIIDECGNERWVSRESVMRVADPDTEVDSSTKGDASSVETGAVESVDLKLAPLTARMTKRIRCPHCDQPLPVDEYTECDQCGAHLELCVKTVAPPQAVSDGGED